MSFCYPMPADELLVGGIWQRGSGAIIESRFSADGSLNAKIHGASRADVDLAVARAGAAQSDPAWRDMKPALRSAILRAIADGIREQADRLTYLQSRDTGKTLGEAMALVQSAAGTFDYFASVCESLDGEVTAERADVLTLSIHEPLGVIAAITPWNSPIASDAQKIAPALAGGNAVVLKPASWSPLVALALGRIMQVAGLPDGVFSVLPGAGGEVGEALVDHPDIAKLSFTGGTETGRRIAIKAAQKLMPVSLELGGKSPTIVFDDCDVDLAIAGILFGIFSSSGQSCIAGSRLFVQKTIYRQFLDRLVKATDNLIVGHSHDPETQMAPLVHPDHRASVEAHVEKARAQGGRILTGGKRPDDPELAQGAYYLPTIIDGLPNRAELCQTEVFGPVLAVLPFEDEADLITQANDSVYGLACGIWSRDFPRCWRIARAIKAGTVWINTYKKFSISTPFGGVKDSGLGREKGRVGLLAYMQQKSIYHDLTGAPHPWARWPRPEVNP